MIKSELLADFNHGFLTRGEKWPTPTIQVKQVHGADVLVVDKAFKPHQEADAMVTKTGGVTKTSGVTKTKGLALAIRTADCVPILLACQKSGVVGAAHAGWRGAYAGIVENTVAAMKKLGATDIIAATGPAIGVENYEVGHDFPIKQHRALKNGQYFFDLKAYVKDKLLASEVKNVDISPHDTYANPDLFYSYRRATHTATVENNRMLAVIVYH